MMLSKEDLEYRKTRIGASDSPIIMGISPWSTPLKLWEQKQGLRELDPVTPAMQRGIDLEPYARQEFIKMTGINVLPERFENADHPWMIATLDGIDESREIIVEVKCPGEKTIEMAKNGEVPDHYYCQIQHQIAVVNPMMAFYFCYDGNMGYPIEIKRDEKMIAAIIEKEKKFYECLLNFIPPEPQESDYEIREEIEWREQARFYETADIEIKLWTQRKERARKKLIEMAQGKNCIGAGIKMTKYITKGRVDYENIPELKDIDLEKHRKPASECWRISNE